MKQIVLFSMSILIISLIGCNKKELEDNRTEIIGTWIANFETFSGCDDPGPGMDIQREVSCTDNDCITYTFQDDGVYFAEFTVEGDNFGEQGTYSLDIDEITLCIEDDGENICNGGDYDVSGLSLSFSFVDPETGCTVFRTFDKVMDDPS